MTSTKKTVGIIAKFLYLIENRHKIGLDISELIGYLLFNTQEIHHLYDEEKRFQESLDAMCINREAYEERQKKESSDEN